MKKVLIEVSEDILNNINEPIKDEDLLRYIIRNGTPLDGLTNGEVIQMLFPKTALRRTSDCEYGLRPLDSNWIIWFKGDWWNRKWGE